MKIIIRLVAIAVLIAVPVTINAQEQKSSKQDKNIETVKFETSITCDMCVNTIMNSLPREKGVKDVKTDLDSKTVTVTYRKDKNDTEKLKRALEKLGYTAKPLPTGKEKK
jgi:copper chaperone CopZ